MGAPQLTPEELAAIDTDNIRFSIYVLLALSGLVVISAIYRMTIYSVRYVRTLTCLNDGRQQYFRNSNRTYGWVKRHILYAPLFNKRHNKQMRMGSLQMGVLPTRLQSILLIGIITMNVTLCVYGIEWNGPLEVKLRHLRNRSGTLAVANMIPLVLVAGRNNPLIGLLNVSFDAFSLLHRWFGRIVASLAVTHGVVEIISMITGAAAGKNAHSSGFAIFIESLRDAPYLLWGFIAFITMITIILTTFTSFRHAYYETFLHLHVALVSLILAALWIHLRGLQQKNYVKATIAIWGFERLLRLSSLLYRNVGRTTTSAAIEPLPDDTMRITLRLARPLRFHPGQYIYLTIPSIGLWTSHPFSIAWSETTSPQPQTPNDPEKAHATHTSSSSSKEPTPTNPQKTLSLLLRRHRGFTSHLYTRLLSTPCPTQPLTLPCLISGSYGNPPTLSSYGSILLFAGGIGITPYLTLIRSLLTSYAASTAAVRRVTLVWMIRSPECLAWIRPWMTRILSLPRRREVLRILLFVTRSGGAGAGGREICSPTATVQMFPSKPDIDALVETECRDQIGAMAVSVCGPGGMGDDVRAAVRKRQGDGNIDFVEEGFGW